MLADKTVAILQSNYIPWKGYFDIISSVDEFIFYDEVQYTKHDWRNRNKIKTHDGLLWLTIPVSNKGVLQGHQRVLDTQICDPAWAKKHWKSITQSYSKASFFDEYKELFEDLYLAKEELFLCEVNYKFIRAICGILGVDTALSHSTEYTPLTDGKTERLVDLVKQAKGTEYISGPSAKDYIDEKQFEEAGIKLTYKDYSGYPEYTQFKKPFEHGVTILDLLFNTGPDASYYIWKWRNEKTHIGE